VDGANEEVQTGGDLVLEFLAPQFDEFELFHVSAYIYARIWQKSKRKVKVFLKLNQKRAKKS
jgi:hypothetical protein